MARPKVGDIVEIIEGNFKHCKGRISTIPSKLYCSSTIYFIKVIPNIGGIDAIEIPFIREQFKVEKNVK